MMPSSARHAWLWSALVVLLCSACSGGDDDPAAVAPVASVAITPPQATVAVGATTQLTAQTRSADGSLLSGRAVIWTSGNSQIAVVDGNGLVRGMAAGSTSIIAASEGQSAAATVTVTPPPAANIAVTPNPASVMAGSNVQLTATARDAGGNVLTGKTFVWASSNASVANVDQSGRVIGVAAGSANVTASVDNVSGTSAVTVTQTPAVSVIVTPNPASVTVGSSLQLTASARDQAGNVIPGKTFVWNSSNTGVATVDQTGRVAGVTVGSAIVSAVVDNVTGTTPLTVQPPPPISITQITPSPLIEGQPATLTGTGFGASASANVVTIEGLEAQVTQASSTSLQIVVPIFNCRPRRTAPVVVTVAGQSSPALNATLSPTGVVALSVGQQLVLSGNADRCLHFDAASQSERYVIGVQSVSEVVSTLTGVTVNGILPGATTAGAMLPPPLDPPAGAPLSPQDLAAAERWSRHVESTVAAYERERVLLQPIADRLVMRAPAPAAAAPTVPGTVQEGEQVTIRFPDFNGNTCTTFTNIPARVRKISQRGIFVEDLANPVQLAQSVFDQAAADFAAIYDIDVDHFGAPSDIDANQRVVIVVTREVNRVQSPPLGFVSSASLFPVATCPASNEGEFFYMRAADPTGEFTAGTYTVTTLVNDFSNLLAHETAHIIQGSRRKAAGGQFMVSWLAEGLAVAAQEVAGFQILNLQNGMNYGRSRVFSSLGADPRAFFGYMADLIAYAGYDFAGNHRAAAPEECSWVGATGANGNPGPCAFPNRLVYGVPWSLIKNAIDRFHGGTVGQKQILRAFSDRVGPLSGFSDLEAVLGRPMTTLIADWAPMFYLDDRFAAAGFQSANWNTRDLAAAYHSNAHLQPRLRGFTNFADAFNVRAGSAAYYDVSGINRPAISLRIRDALGNTLPPFMIVWVVRVPINPDQGP